MIGGGRDGPGIGYFVIVMLLDMVFGLFASMIAMAFSRHREFRADAGGVELVDDAEAVEHVNAAGCLVDPAGARRGPAADSRGHSPFSGAGGGDILLFQPPENADVIHHQAAFLFVALF